MNPLFPSATIVTLFFRLCVCTAAVSASCAKAFEWSQAKPEAHGFSSAALGTLRDDLAARRTKIFLLICDDDIIYEWYAPGFAPNQRHYTASMAKAVVGGVAFAVAADRTSLKLDDLASKYIPEWREDPRKSTITLRHLGSHTSGISDAEGSGNPGAGWMGEFWKRLPPPHDPFTVSRDVAPLVSKPGAEFHYSNPGIAMLAYATTVALQQSSEKDIRTLLAKRVIEPIGIPADEWECGYGQTFEVNNLPLVGTWGGGAFSGRAAARIGRLMLRKGDWDGKKLISEESVKTVTADSHLPGAVNCGWWTNGQNRVPALPRDAFWAAGHGGQTLLVIPSLKLIMVRNGDRLSDEQNDDALANYVFTPLMHTRLKSEIPGKEQN
ncbi:MAG TPA: serine hydrolase [Opitutaceae bacterium]|nr:serine hydrolase [Opitutaceae bacterium]